MVSLLRPGGPVPVPPGGRDPDRETRIRIRIPIR